MSGFTPRSWLDSLLRILRMAKTKKFVWRSSCFSAGLAALILFIYHPPAFAGFRELFTGDNQTPTLKRGINERIDYNFPETGVKLKMPRFLKNPRKYTTDGGDVLVMLRTAEDTCGLYQISETIAPYQVGPPPHFHFASGEWFFPTEDSSFRIYGTQENIPLKPGQLPGVNVDAPSMGSITIGKGDLVYSPKGTVHLWHNESTTRKPIRGFYNIWNPADGVDQWFSGINNVDGSHNPLGDVPGPQALTLQSALWGVPHDPTGKFVGRADYRNIRGPLAENGNHIEELQDLFDRGEACYPQS